MLGHLKMTVVDYDEKVIFTNFIAAKSLLCPSSTKNRNNLDLIQDLSLFFYDASHNVKALSSPRGAYLILDTPEGAC